MTVPVFAAVVLLSGAPADIGDAPAAQPEILARPVNASQAVQTTASESPAPQPPLPSAPDAASPGPADPATADAIASPDHGDIVVTAQPRSVPGDPLQQINATSFEVTQTVDKAFVRPAALAYRHVVPRPIRSGFRNFLSNLTEPVIFVNFLLQLKPGKAAETAGRFAINSTIGAVGVFDIAKRRPINLPYRPNGFANTMGYYGIKSGPFLFLPIVGPTTVRDMIGLSLDRLLVPLAVGKPLNQPAYAISTGTLSSLDQRSEFDKKLQRLHDESPNPYAATREDYLQHRQAEIDGLRGKPSVPARPLPEPLKPPAD